MSTLRVLGAVEVVRGDSGHGGVPGLEKSVLLRRLLAALAVRAGEVVSADWLADAVYAEHAPAHATGSLQTLVSRLRGALSGCTSIALVTRPPGYVLDLADGVLDAAEFDRLAQRAHALLTEDPAAAAGLLDGALALWSGAAYAEFAAEEFARAEASRLEEVRSVAIEDRFEAALLLGRHHEVAARLEPLVAAEPFRERRRGQLMLARHRSGRTADALQGYRSFRALLDEQLGVEPSEELQRLHTAILRGDPGLGWAPTTGSRVAASRAGTIAPPAKELFDRDEEQPLVADLVSRHSLVTLIGPGGVGKTSLARAVAHGLAGDFPDGARAVGLAPVADPEQVPLAVASALDVPGRHGTEPAERVVEWLSGQQMLLVVDNCEHVLDAVAGLVDAVRQGAPGVHLLLTSQAPVRVDGEQVVAVRPLTVPLGAGRESPAVRLFAARARSHRRDFALADGEVGAVVDVCRRLDGLPLAIELAAARMSGMSPTELAARLSGRFRLLHGGARTADERHRTLRALVDWSYSLLDDSQKRVFEALSVFAGSFTLDQAERLVSTGLPAEHVDAAAVADQVLALVDRSMLVCTPGAPTAYHLLETLRSYGRERLRDRGAHDRLRAVHAEQLAALVSPTRLRLFSVHHLADVAVVAQALDDLRTAFGWALERDVPSAARMVAGTATLLELRMTAEVAHWARDLVAGPLTAGVPDGCTADEAAWVHAVAAAGARFTGALSEAAELADRARALATEPATRVYAAYVASETAYFRRDPELAGALLAEAMPLALGAGLAGWSGLLAVNTALERAYVDGDPVLASRIAEEVEAEAEQGGMEVVAAWATYVRGEVLLEDDPATAAPLLEAALAKATATGDRYLIGVTLLSLASALSRYGEPAEAIPLFRRAVEHWHRSGNWTHQWTTLRNVVVFLSRLGRDRAAAGVDGALTARRAATEATGAEAVRMRRTREGLLARLGQEGYHDAARAGARLSDDALIAMVAEELTDR